MILCSLQTWWGDTGVISHFQFFNIDDNIMNRCNNNDDFIIPWSSYDRQDKGHTKNQNLVTSGIFTCLNNAYLSSYKSNLTNPTNWSQCTCSWCFTSPNALFRTEMCTFLSWMMHCEMEQAHQGICELGQSIYQYASIQIPTKCALM